MPNWANSDRRGELPPNWKSEIRPRILRRDSYRCTHTDSSGVRCNQAATDVDHIRPGNDHTDSNLRSLCSGHHGVKSSSEGGTASAARRRQVKNSFRRREKHPGLL